MKPQHQQIVDEVNAHLDTWVREKRIVNPDWLTKFIVDRHPNIQGADVSWYQICAYGHVRDTVRQCVGRFKSKPEDVLAPTTGLLPGFDYLNQSYLIPRDGEQMIVPIHEMTDAELEVKAREYERMSEGCVRHAAELRRYKTLRDRKAQ